MKRSKSPLPQGFLDAKRQVEYPVCTNFQMHPLCWSPQKLNVPFSGRLRLLEPTKTVYWPL